MDDKQGEYKRHGLQNAKLSAVILGNGQRSSQQELRSRVFKRRSEDGPLTREPSVRVIGESRK